MASAPVLLDSDMVAEIARGNLPITTRAEAYLREHGRFTISAISVFERLRGYRAALRAGKPVDEQLHQFQAFVATCRVLPVDDAAAEHASLIWAELGARALQTLGDVLIAATASANSLALATRRRRDFEVMTRIAGVRLQLVDWTR